MPFPDNTLRLHHHFVWSAQTSPTKRQRLRSMYRVLKPGGRLLAF
ncbi:hypothetical protein ACNKHX_23860 [Shigella flexneri]